MSMNLTIKTTGGNCEVEVPDEATVEMLRVIVYSAKPELGEDLRLIFQGKVLKNDEDLVVSSCGMKEGDYVAAAKGKSMTGQPPAAAVATPTPPAEKPAEETPPATFAPPSRAQEPAAPDVSSPSAAPAAPAPAAAEAAAASDAPAKTEAAAPASPEMSPEAVTPPVPLSPGEAAEPAAKRPCTEDLKEEHAAEAGAAEGATAAPAAPASPPAEDLPPTPENLMVLAARVESGDVPPEEVAAMLRKAASKVELLGGAVNELGQALQLVNVMSGRVLQQIGVPVVSGPNGLDAPVAQAPKEEESRSFMVKKGDADVQALHERANAMGSGNRAGPTSPSHGSSGTCAWGGSTNASGTPMSREDMDKARQARLARLEKQQADKQKEKEDAEEKSRSRLALERMGTVGPAKTIGKF